jgi:hypothetical protein
MKGHKIALVIGAVFVGLLCMWGAYETYKAFDNANDVKKSLNDYLHKLQSFYHKNPFPRVENTRQVQDDEKNISEWTQVLGKDLLASQPTQSTSKDPSFFKQDLQQTVRRLHGVAASSSTKIGADSAAASFGFFQYLGKTGVMPKPEDVPRLSLQLAMTDTLMREIFACHIQALTSIERETFEAGLASTALSSARHRGPVAPVPAPTPAPGVATSGNGLYSKQHFTITFLASERSLLLVLNHLAQMPMFVVITDLETTREDRGLVAVPAKTANTETNRLERAQRLVSGSEMSSPLKVRLQVDVYTFNGV